MGSFADGRQRLVGRRWCNERRQQWKVRSSATSPTRTVDPDLFITAAFVSWVLLFALLGVALIRYERRRDDSAAQVDNLARAPSEHDRLSAGQVRAGAPADWRAPGGTFSA
jgi:hypothetical protein